MALVITRNCLTSTSFFLIGFSPSEAGKVTSNTRIVITIKPLVKKECYRPSRRRCHNQQLLRVFTYQRDGIIRNIPFVRIICRNSALF